MRHFCSLWDINYMAKGLALHASLLRHSSDPFTLWILPMDEEAATVLHALQLASVKVLTLSAFESVNEMSAVKESRSRVEYLWTCASVLCDYLLRGHREMESLTYLDADLFFFSDPKAVFDEIGDRSIAIVPHRFADKDKARLEPNGIYNVGWVTFRNDLDGCACLAGWAEKCRDWCYNSHDGGRFGDQKYLDSWLGEFGDALCIIQNVGVGLAPWNIANHSVGGDNGLRVWVYEGGIGASQLVMFHFHEYRDESDLTRWPLRAADIELIYRPYIQALREAQSAINGVQMEAEWERA